MAPKSELGSRLAVAGVGIPLVAGLIYMGGWVLAGLMALVAVLGMREFAHLAAQRDVQVFTTAGVLAGLLLVASAAWEPNGMAHAARSWSLLVALTLTLLIAAVFLRSSESQPLAAVSATVMGVVYLAGTLTFALLIRHFGDTRAFAGAANPPAWEGTVLLVFPMLVTWFGDSVAYFCGKRFGKAKLAPKVSPNKTVLGAVTGLAGAMLAGGVWGAVALSRTSSLPVPWWAAVIMGLALGALAQVGDLAESVLKREAGVKDSGQLLPGHGGVLDRFDALYFTIPAAYALFVLWERIQ